MEMFEQPFKYWLNNNIIWIIKADKRNKYSIILRREHYGEGVIIKITGR